MKKWDNFKKKYLGKVDKWMSWLFNIVGLILAILSFIKNDADLGWGIVLSIVIFNNIFLILISAYESRLYKKGNEIERRLCEEKETEISKLMLEKEVEISRLTMEKETEISKLTLEKETVISKLSSKLNHINSIADKLRYYYKYIILTLNKYVTHLYAVNSNSADEKQNVENLVHQSQSSGDDNEYEKSVKILLEKTENNYRESMLREFNRFLRDITNELRIILEEFLREKDCLLETSISVKQFNRIVVDPSDINDVRVITTFRDQRTYLEGKREIGLDEYSINKNTDFAFCLTQPYFWKNNIKEKDPTYANEHDGFLDIYNCTIVVPIKYEYPDCEHFYGYLTCDVLNEDIGDSDIFDDKMAEIMVATASIIGTYFDNMDYQWECVFEDDFLDIVYNMKRRCSIK